MASPFTSSSPLAWDSRNAMESRASDKPTPDRTRSSMDASWSTSATALGVSPSESNLSVSRRWCTESGGVQIHGSAALSAQPRPVTCAPPPLGAPT
ncbi:hypothetical protein G6F23_015985 [Rhizopus arrhizus]|nr:hypothetical protein G6F23_015985 [Rhizopus arrhizus]